jgi:hypothetical protein
MEALDLTKQPPRSPRETLPGLDVLMLARTVDKVRATLPGGNLGAYKIPGFSGRVLEGLGIDEAALRDEVARASGDAEVAAWFAARIDTANAGAINAMILAPTVASRLHDAEWMEKNPVAKTLPPDTPLVDFLILDDREAFAKT